MSEITKKAIIRALIEGVLTELYPKTSAEQVMLDANTNLATKLSELIVALNAKATTEALTSGLSGKSNTGHGHAQSEITGLSTALNAKASIEALNTAIANLRTELMGEGVKEAYDTFKELADAIEENAELADALNSAIGNKADKTTVNAIKAITDALGELSKKDKVSESDLDTTLAAKINSVSQSNHSHSNKALLDTYDQTNANIKDAVTKRHGHDNKAVLDSITATKVSGWDGKSRVIVQATQPADLAAGDLWIQVQ